MKPSFIVIGGVKCGTSSLYRYLNQHPNILPCRKKEPRIFSTRNIFKTYYKFLWYLRLFPKKEFEGWVKANWVSLTKDETLESNFFLKKKEVGKYYITGEASADTFAKAYPWILKSLFPKIKLIVLLRNPTKRFISHYKMQMRFAREGRRNYKLVKLNEYLDKQLFEFSKGNHRDVLGQGIYIYHLNRWFKCFPKKQIYICETNSLANSVTGQIELNKMFNFLGLDKYEIVDWQKFNVSNTQIALNEQFGKLNEFYKPYNEVLYQKIKIGL